MEADRWHGGKYLSVLRATPAEPELALGVEGPANEQVYEAAEKPVSSGVGAALPTAAAGVFEATCEAAVRRHRFEEIRARARADIIESKALVERIRMECGAYAFRIAACPPLLRACVRAKRCYRTKHWRRAVFQRVAMQVASSRSSSTVG